MKKVFTLGFLLSILFAIVFFNRSHHELEQTTPTAITPQQTSSLDTTGEAVGESTTELAVIERISTPDFADLAEIRERRLLRVLVEYSNTNFFFDGPSFRGFDYEIMREYEKYLNKGASNESDRVVATFIVKPFSEILDDLVAGRGDIAIANLTVTPKRQEIVNFTDPYLSDVNEIIIHHKSIEGFKSIEELSGYPLYLLAGSSFIQHTELLNDQLKSKNIAPLKIIEASSGLSVEDILEMVNANVFPFTVVDDFTAHTWESVLPDIRVRDDLVVNSGGQIAWAVRKESKDLLDSLNGFIKEVRQGSLLGNIFFKRYYQDSKWIDNPTSPAEVTRLDKYKPVIQKYAQQYDFDWLSIAAMAYQESKLDQTKVSPAGAVGIMQIKPTTAASHEVGIEDITNTENNINAGVKYLAYLRERYFSTPEIAAEDKVDFTWAAYNAGPARIAELRKIAANSGYDPNIWFSNVERIAAREIGRETVRYVANINKYYIAYKLAEEKL